MNTKYVFVTGGVVSSVGKGIVTGALGRMLKERGLVVFKDLSRYKTYLEMVREKAMRM